MTNRRFWTAAAAVLGALLVGTACFEASLSSGGGTPGAGGITTQYRVVYSASAGGDGEFDELRYLNAEGVQVIVFNPTLPFTVELPMQGGDQVAMVGTARVTTGSARIRVTATRTTTDSTTVDVGDDCQSSGTFLLCELSIPAQSL
jgi:hypothetical protein